VSRAPLRRGMEDKAEFGGSVGGWDFVEDDDVRGLVM
jgi:hypothetical protein